MSQERRDEEELVRCVSKVHQFTLHPPSSIALVLRDVVDQLAEVSPGAPFVEDYNPVPLRADAGLAAPPYEAALRMADC